MQRVALVEFYLCQHVVSIDIGQPEVPSCPSLIFEVATHHGGRVGLFLFVGIARPRQEQAGLVALGRVVEAHAIEARLVERQRREAGRDLIADHQPVRRCAALVRSDDQAVEEVAVGRSLTGHQVERGQAAAALVDKTAARAGLFLLPVVHQPAAAEGCAKGVVGLVAFEDQADIAQVCVAGKVASLIVPRSHIGLGQVARPVPLVGRRRYIVHLKGLAVGINPTNAPVQKVVAVGHRRPEQEDSR